MTEDEDDETYELMRLKRIDLSASYLNIVAAGVATTGAIAPLAAYVAGIAGADTIPISRVTLAGICFLLGSAMLHILALFLLGRIVR